MVLGSRDRQQISSDAPQVHYFSVDLHPVLDQQVVLVAVLAGLAVDFAREIDVVVQPVA